MEQRESLQIRDEREGEREAIRNVTLAAYEEYAGVVSASFWEEYRRHLLATVDTQGPVEHIVAELSGTIVGSVLLYPPFWNAYTGAIANVDWPVVRLLAVAPAARGQGVGAALMDECEQRARRMGASLLGLHTADIMRIAMRMYERRGFVRASELDFRPAEDVLVKGYLKSLKGV
jgi:GNAT superfamily N-acetyltransferase